MKKEQKKERERKERKKEKKGKKWQKMKKGGWIRLGKTCRSIILQIQEKPI